MLYYDSLLDFSHYFEEKVLNNLFLLKNKNLGRLLNRLVTVIRRNLVYKLIRRNNNEFS